MLKLLSAAAALALLAIPSYAQQFTPARIGPYNGVNNDKLQPPPGLDVTGLGQFAGYQFNRYLSAEMGLRQLPDIYMNSFNGTIVNGQVLDKDVKAEQLSLSLMARYPVTQDVDLYARAGLQRTQFTSRDGRVKAFDESVAGVGASYAVTPKTDLRVETQRVNARPTLISVGAGLKF